MRLIQTPMVRWSAKLERMDHDARRLTCDEACALAVRAARLSAYVSCRMAGGSHVRAVKEQNRAAAAVRRALGFTYPDPVSF